MANDISTKIVGNLSSIIYVTKDDYDTYIAKNISSDVTVITYVEINGISVPCSKLIDYRIKEPIITVSSEIVTGESSPASSGAIADFIKGYSYSKDETSTIISNFLKNNTISTTQDLVLAANSAKYVTAGAISQAIANATGEKYEFVVSNQTVSFNATVHNAGTVNSFSSSDGRLTFSAGTNNSIQVGVIYPPIYDLI